MTKTTKSDQERWRDEFEGRGQTPMFWQIHARSLLCAANVLWERARVIASNPKRIARHYANKALGRYVVSRMYLR